jgi:hypothetical protein
MKKRSSKKDVNFRFKVKIVQTDIFFVTAALQNFPQMILFLGSASGLPDSKSLNLICFSLKKSKF